MDKSLVELKLQLYWLHQLQMGMISRYNTFKKYPKLEDAEIALEAESELQKDINICQRKINKFIGSVKL